MSSKIRSNISLTLGFIACFVLVAIAAVYQNTSLPTSAQAEQKQIVVIDSGHGGLDSGCVGVNGCYEKDINLAIAQNLKELLEATGFEVVMTRDEDISIYDNGVEGIRNQKISDMENRLEIVQSYPESIFISIHQNQYTQPQYFGAQMFYTTNNDGNFRFAKIMQECFAELQPDNDREIKLIDNNLYLFKETTQPALLIECGFLSNEQDAANLSDKEYRKRVAFAVYKGITGFMAQTKSADVQLTEESKDGKTENTLYMQ